MSAPWTDSDARMQRMLDGLTHDERDTLSRALKSCVRTLGAGF